LEFSLQKPLSFRLRSGRFVRLNAGIYFYVGSAFGSGGIQSRLSRHLKKSKKKHWHLDFITTSEAFTPISAIAIPEMAVECALASIILELASPIPKFGSSDCKCLSHLFLAEEPERIKEEIFKRFPAREILLR